MMRMRFMWMLFFVVPVWAAPLVAPDSLTEVLEQFSSKTKINSCELREKLIDTDPCPRCKKVWEITQKRSCEELFADAPPAWARMHNLLPEVPTQQVSTAKPPLRPEPPLSKEWFPFCTVYQVDLQMSKLPFPAASRLEVALERAHTAQRNRDLCDPRSPYYSQNRYDEKYVPATQEERRMTPMNADEINTMKETASKWIDRVGDECCGKDLECAKYFKRLHLPDCKAQTDPKTPDPCLDHAAFWEKKDKGGYGPDVGEPDWKPSADEPFYAGRMLLAPYKPTSDTVSMTLDGLLAHELAHACSNIHIRMAEYRKEPNVIKVPSTKDDPGCEITEPVKKFYRERLSEIGLNAESADCLFERSSRAPMLRFRASEKCGSGGCAVIQLDEAYAMLHGFAHTTDAADAVPIYLPSQFCGFRDPEHLMGADVLACAVKTPEFRRKMESLVKCRAAK